MVNFRIKSKPAHTKRSALVAALLALTSLSACTVGPSYQRPDIAVPKSFALTEQVKTSPVSWQSFTAFKSPVLDAILARALVANTDIAGAKARLAEAKAYRGLTPYSLFPTVTQESSAERSKASQRDPQIPPDQGTQKRFDVGFDALWEIDLFGSLRNQSAAVWLRSNAAEAELQAVQRSVLAETAQAFFSSIGERERLRVLERNVGNLREALRIVEALADAGRGNELDVSRAKAQLHGTLAQRAQQAAHVDRQQLRLSTLLAEPLEQTRARLDAQNELPRLSQIEAVGTPKEWLQRRPDVAAAEFNLRAATHDVGTQVAEYFPKLTLLGGFGSVSSRASDLGDSASERWRFGPSISWQFLNAGRVRQFVRAEQAQADQVAANYRATVLAALEETEGALSNFRATNTAMAELTSATQAAEKARALAELRFEAGASDYLAVLDAQRARLQLDDQLAQAHIAHASAMVMLYKALGGDFVRAID